jgi:hypothetical protein
VCAAAKLGRTAPRRQSTHSTQAGPCPATFPLHLTRPLSPIPIPSSTTRHCSLMARIHRPTHTNAHPTRCLRVLERGATAHCATAAASHSFRRS